MAELLLPEVLRNLVLSASEANPMILATLASQLSFHVLKPAADAVPLESPTAAAAGAGGGAGTAQAGFSRGTAGPSVGVDVRAVRAVLSALEYLRSIHRDDILAAGDQKGIRATKTAAGSTAGGTNGGRGAVAAGQEPRLWSKVYCLEVDYLLVAKAALRSGCAAFASCSKCFLCTCLLHHVVIPLFVCASNSSPEC